MALVLVLISVGGIMVYSSLKGVSIAEAFQDATGRLDPRGGSTGATGDPVPDAAAGEQPTSSNLNNGHSTSEFKGPKSLILGTLAHTAVDRFDLTITEICRAQNAGYGAPDSKHKECAAFDASGSAQNMLAYARYAHAIPGIVVFYDPAGYVAPGYEHGDHVHTQ